MTTRTPLCLIPEEDDIYDCLYCMDQRSPKTNAKTQLNPIGMVKVKLDPIVLPKNNE